MTGSAIAPATLREPGEIVVRHSLTLRTAFKLCRLIRMGLEAGTDSLALDLSHVRMMDVVGLAAVLQTYRRATERGVPVWITASAAVQRALLSARLVEEIPVTDTSTPSMGLVAADGLSAFLDEPGPAILRTENLTLRRPSRTELGSFGGWAQDAELRYWVGSELLYRCRHLGWRHPDFAHALLGDPTQLAFVIQPAGEPLHLRMVERSTIQGAATPRCSAQAR